MANKLTTLLSLPTTKRTVNDYEEMYDDFIDFAGGSRISRRFVVPEGKKNADYHFDLELFEIVLELKQLSKFCESNTVAQYFLKRLSEGKIRCFEKLPNNKIRINPASLGKSDWNDFYKRFRPSISSNLKTAASQLRDTEDILPPAKKRRIKGVMLINSGDFNMPTDLLFRLVEWKVKREWKIGHFRSIDFVSCSTIDMHKDQQHPLYSRHIARSTQDNNLVEAVRYLFDRWVNYGASALGLEVHRSKRVLTENAQVNLNQPFTGKILWHPPV